MKETTNLAKSVLELKSLYFDTIEFRRKDGKNSHFIKYGVNCREVKQDDQNPSHFWLILGTNITDKQKEAVEINVSLVGEFIVSADENNFDILRLIKENGVAILFPCLRSELTLLTTQPGFHPIVLPAVNIAKMFQN